MIETKPAEPTVDQQPVTLEEMVLQKFRSLPTEQKRSVLDFVEFLEQKSQPKQPRQSFIGLCADQGIHITKEEIDEARREMWGGSGRKDV